MRWSFQKACALHVGVYRNGGEILRLKRHIGFYQHILKTEDGKGGLVVIFALFAGVDDLLQGRCYLFAGALNVLLGEFTVFVQQLAEAQLEFTSPATVRGLKVTLNGSKCTLGYGNLTFSADVSSLPQSLEIPKALLTAEFREVSPK
mgnify:CR=1 FL=1